MDFPPFPPPVVENDPVEVADSVFVIEDGGVMLVPNVGIVRGERATLVIDPGLGANSGKRVRGQAEALNPEAALFVTTTHFHGEHSFGLQAFESGSTIVANRTQLKEEDEKIDEHVGLFRSLAETIAAEMEDLRLVRPHLLYDGEADLDLGGLTVQLRPKGRGHTRGDQVVFLPQQRVLFAGDLVEGGSFAIFPGDGDDDGDRWIEILVELEALDPAVVVGGHGKLGGREVITAAREYLELLRSEAGRLADEGASEDEAAAAIEASMQELHPDWLQPVWIEGGARHFYEKHAARAGDSTGAAR